MKKGNLELRKLDPSLYLRASALDRRRQQSIVIAIRKYAACPFLSASFHSTSPSVTLPFCPHFRLLSARSRARSSLATLDLLSSRSNYPSSPRVSARARERFSFKCKLFARPGNFLLSFSLSRFESLSLEREITGRKLFYSKRIAFNPHLNPIVYYLIPHYLSRIERSERRARLLARVR